MKKSTRSWKERICALLLAVAMVITWMIPNAALTAEAAPGDAGAVYFSVQDVEKGNTLLTQDVTIKVLDNASRVVKSVNTAETQDTDPEHVNMFKVTGLDTNTEYTYTVEKTGYEYNNAQDERKFTLTSSDMSIEVGMKMSEIILDKERVSLKVGEYVDVDINNQVKGETYAWTVTEGQNYVSVVDGTITANKAGAAGDDETKQAKVQVGLKGKTKTVTVQIAKNNVDNLALTVKEPSGNDQSEVKLTATGIPSDATGILVFKADGVKIGEADARDNATVTYDESEEIIAKKIFTVEYSGDTKYTSKSASAEGNYTKTQNLEIDGENSKEITYGDPEWDTPFDVSLKADTVKERHITANVEFVNPDEYAGNVLPEQVAEVAVENNQIKITPKNAGEIKITITAEANNSYIASSIDFTLLVKRKEISVNDVAWDDNLSKTYDGTTNFQLTGTVVDTTERITIDSSKVHTDTADVAIDEAGNVIAKDVRVEIGEYKSTNESSLANYLLKVTDENDLVAGIATINYRPLYVTAKGCDIKSFEYGQNIKDAVERTAGLITLENSTGYIEKDPSSGLVNNDKVSELPGATIDGNGEFIRLEVQDDPFNIVKPDITEQNRIDGNYEFKFDDTVDNRGSLIVTSQTINKDTLLKCIELSESTTGIYDVKESDANDTVLKEIYVNTGARDEFGEDKYGSDEESPVLKLRVKDSENFEATAYYDEVFISINGKPAINATEDGIPIDTLETVLDGLKEKEVDKHAVQAVSVYVGRKDSAKTMSKSVMLNDWLYIDNKAPVADISGFTATAYSKMVDSITFGMYTNKMYTASVTVTDKGSGLSDSVSQQYYIWNVGSDIGDADLNEEEVKKQIETITEKGEWSPLDLSTGVDTFEVGRGENEQAIEDNYIIFIKTVDNADNCSVYVSNGMVIDITQPEINCTFAPATATQDGIDNYQGKAEYKINIKDPEPFFSGIDSVQVDVTVNGEKVDSGIVIDSINETTLEQTYENSFKIELKDNDKLYSDLVKESDFTINAVVPARSVEPDMNDVIITITTIDKAGNEAQAFEKKIVIDNISPKVEVSYNDDINKANNDIYFNNKEESRIMTVKYTERNMDIGNSEDPYPDISFDITVNGDKYDGVHLNELSQYGITWVNEEVKDYIGNKPISDFVVTEYTEARTCTIQLEFDKDGEYSITPHCEDILGNRAEKITYADETSKANEFFIIDQTAPVVTVVYSVDEADDIASDIEDAISEDKRVYTNRYIHAWISIEEKNFSYEKTFAESQSDFSATIGTDAPEGIEDFSKFESRSEWSYDATNTGKTTLDFVKDANYIFSFTYTDLAGNSYTYAPHYFTFDQTEPTGSIKVNGTDNSGILKDLIRTISFGFFFNNDTKIEFTSEDATSVYKQQYYMYNPGDIHGSVDQLDIQGNTAHEMTLENITIDEWIGRGDYQRINNPVVYYTQANTQQVPYMRLEDKAGNVSFISTAGVIDDRQAPDNAPKITITTAEPLHGIYNKDVDFEIQVIDPKVNGTYSGLKEVSYEILKDGEVTQSGNYNNELLDATQRMQSITRNETVEAEINNSNNVQIKVTAVDQSGNKATETKNLSIDITAPTIDVTYDLNSPLNDRYYNATRTATVTVTERNFDPSAVRFNITNTDGTQPSISGWSHSSNSGVSDSATHTCTVTFAADGDYTFTLNTTDLAGNDSNYTRVDDFTIDQTDPTIQVSYDNNNDAEPGYFNADRTATITVTEHNFNAADVNTAITASLEGRGVATPGLGGWSTRGDVHTASVTFSADADYTFDVDYTDLAGNAAADYEQDSFTVDQTAPELEFFDIEDKSANNDVVAPGVRYSDNNYTENGVEITLEGANHGEMALDGDRSSIPNGESIKMADFERTKENDDLYTMTAVITDRAGNETEDSVIFSVNRFGSVFILSDETQELVDNYYTNEEQDLVVTEINVDSLVFNGISYGRDGQLADLKAGTDYTVKASGSEVSWKQYDYTINKENFEKEGNYTVTIDSEDRATNVGNSRAKGCDIEFAIDKTAPTVVITGIENGEQYRANTRNITVNAADNIAMGDVGVYVGNDDQPAQSYDAKDIQAAGGELTYTMNSSNSRQDIRAVATDAAGNTAEAEITRVLLTSNLFVQFYSNTPLLVGTIVGVVVIAGGLLWFFLIFKRKKDEEQANK